MARDAITRQYDVNKNLTTLTCAPGKEGYRPGVITFFAKPGKSIDLDKIQESLIATRLSGGTSMSVDYLEITARGSVISADKELKLKVAASGEEFILGEEPGSKEKLAQLRDALTAGAKVTTLT